MLLSISLSWPCCHLVFNELLLEQLVPDLEASLQQGQVLVGEDLGEKSPITEKGSSSAQHPRALRQSLCAHQGIGSCRTLWQGPS